jgi:hypothetical protein
MLCIFGMDISVEKKKEIKIYIRLKKKEKIIDYFL